MKKSINVALTIVAVSLFIGAVFTRGFLFLFLLLACSGAVCTLLELNGKNVTRY